MVKTLKISNKTLTKIQAEMGWKGTGSQEDPIIVDSVKGYRTIIKFKNTQKFILLTGVMVCEVRLVKCMNITIRYCEIYHLLFNACHNNTVIDSSVVHGNLTYSKENIFKNNLLQKKRAYDTLRSKQGNTLAKGIQILYSCPLGFMVILLIFFLFNEDFVMIITSLVFMVLFSLPIIDLQIKKHKTKKLPENIFENNIEANLDKLLQIYADYRL